MTRFPKLFSFIIVLIMVAGLIGPVGLVSGAAFAKAHPLLTQLAAEQPDQLVAVIVQKLVKDSHLEEMVAQLGGVVTRDLRIINAFAAQMEAQDALALACDPGVRWVSLDAPVKKSTLLTETLADWFDVQSYSNSNGTQPWLTDWVELNDDGNPSAGKVRIDKGQLKLEDKNKGIQRSLDLSTAETAMLSFGYRRDRLDKPSKYVNLEISTDGGATWTLLYTFANGKDSVLQPFSLDISSYLSENTTLRFFSSPSDAGKLYVDNLVIEYTWDDTPPPPPPGPIELPPLPPADYPFTQYVQDDMYAPAILDYRFNSGSRNWSSPWIEIGEDDGPKSGDIRHAVYDYWDRIRLYEYAYSAETWTPVKGIWRSTDLSTATTAVLSFVYRRYSLENNDYVSLEISADGGAIWFEIDRFGAGPDLQFQSASYNISPFISSEVVIRFTTNYGFDDYSDNFVFDDVNIDFDPQPLPAPPYTFLETLGVPALWNMNIKGHGVVVAVIDSGMAPDWDFQRLPGEPGNTSSRLHTQVAFNDNTNLAFDTNGHGTHVAGVIGGSGQKSNGLYKGIAPNVGFISLKVADDDGAATESDVVEALQWVYDNNNGTGPYTIRVVNLSLNSTVEQSYHNSPINAAVEILWFNGVVVVASAGNTSASAGYNTINAAPANDPFIITVGASDEHGTANRSDDTVASFSAYGTTLDGFAKPDIIAPGKDIVATLAETSWWRNVHLTRYVEDIYFRATGTSMAAPMVTGAVALLLQDEPNLTPDQVKYRLLNTGSLISDGTGHTYPYLDVFGAVTGTTADSANTGTIASQLLWTGSEPVTWGSVAWNSVAWNSVAWNSVAWNSVAWNSVAWNSVAWND